MLFLIWIKFVLEKKKKIILLQQGVFMDSHPSPFFFLAEQQHYSHRLSIHMLKKERGEGREGRDGLGATVAVVPVRL